MDYEGLLQLLANVRLALLGLFLAILCVSLKILCGRDLCLVLDLGLLDSGVSLFYGYIALCFVVVALLPCLGQICIVLVLCSRVDALESGDLVVKAVQQLSKSRIDAPGQGCDVIAALACLGLDLGYALFQLR